MEEAGVCARASGMVVAQHASLADMGGLLTRRIYERLSSSAMSQPGSQQPRVDTKDKVGKHGARQDGVDGAARTLAEELIISRVHLRGVASVAGD